MKRGVWRAGLTSWCGLLAGVALAAPSPGDAPEAAEFPAALSPADSLAAITLRPGLKVELVAAEPLVADPVDIAFGPDGRVWVVEMADYPMGLDGKGQPGGRIRFLEDTDGDGRLDRSTLFLDGLRFPGSVAPWREGVLITAAPDILYAQDTDKDGKADKVDVLYSGFVEGNQQHRVNGLQWGLDNWIYVANGDSGGSIVSRKTGQTVDIGGRDVRIRPDTGALDAQSGKTQYGRNRDDWGNWFGCNNSKPAWHFVLEDQYLRRNPHLAAPKPWLEISETPGAARVFPTSRTLTRFNDADRANRFTSACGLMIYRDDRLGPEFAGNSFVCEPVHNLVHREVVTAEGITFRSCRADDEQQSEFFASADSWSRPTSIRLAPDGSLWVVDMYRLVIEHPKWIPEDWQARIDVRAGEDRGRIYRISNPETHGRTQNNDRATIGGPWPRLDQLATTELVAALDSGNGWQRDMVQQLLLWSADPSAVAPLEHLAQTSTRPLARLHALRTLDGLGKLSSELVAGALRDPHPGVRVHAVQLCESRLAADPTLGPQVLALLDDDDPHVQMQLASTLGYWNDPRAAEALAQVAQRHATQPYVVTAVLSSVNEDNVAALFGALTAPERPQPAPPELLAQVCRLAVALGDNDLANEVVAHATTPVDERFAAWQFSTLAVVSDQLPRIASRLSATTRARLAALFDQARDDAQDESLPVAHRLEAIGLLGRDAENEEDDRELLAELLQPQQTPAIQDAALTTLAQIKNEAVPQLLLDELPAATPRLRSQMVDVLLSRATWTELLLDAVAEGHMPASHFDAGRQQLLLTHRQDAIRERAGTLFANTLSASRRDIVEQHRDALQLAGDVSRGRAVFRKQCAVCHKLEGVGHDVGADLAGLKNKTGEAILIAILDPNEAIEDRYLNFSVLTNEGRMFTGVLASESGASITLLVQEGKQQTILRKDIDFLQSTGKSMMPEGFENQLKRQDLADLVAYISGNQSPPSEDDAPQRNEATKPATKMKVTAVSTAADPTLDVAPGAPTPLVEGNTPQPVRPRDDGTVVLAAHHGQPYGPKIKYMPEWQAFGWWTDQAHVTWELENVPPGEYEVHLEWSVGDNSAGNPFVIEAGDHKLSGTIAKSGSWETFKTAKVGTIELQERDLTLAVKPAGPFNNALMDLRTVTLVPVTK